NTAIMTALPDDLKGFASGMLETARQFGHGMAVPVVSAVMTAAVLRDTPSVGPAAAHLIGYQHAVLLMAGSCFGGVLAPIAGSGSRRGGEKRAAAPRAGRGATPEIATAGPKSV